MSSCSAFPEDGAYMEDESKRKEYVKNETGMIYAGTDASMFTWPWNFAQVSTPPVHLCMFFDSRPLTVLSLFPSLFPLLSDFPAIPVRGRCLGRSAVHDGHVRS